MGDVTERVLDANVFIHAEPYGSRFENPVTVPRVMDELESQDAQTRFDMEDVAVYEPSQESVETVGQEAENRGETLSGTDRDIIALALDRDATIVSDDYGVQNVAEALNVSYEPFVQEGIEETITWEWVCRDCGEPVDGERCTRCGGEPKRVRA